MKIILCIRWRLGKAVLEELYKQHEIVCVITDTQDIIAFCLRKGIPFREIDAKWNEVLNISHDLLISCMFNKIIKEEDLKKSLLGGINIHQAILPLYRGKSPVLAAIKDKQENIGFTIHYMNEYIDSGNVLIQNSWAIDYKISLEELMDQYLELVPPTLKFAIDLVLNGNQGIIQNESLATYCSAFDMEIDWSWSLEKILKKMEDEDECSNHNTTSG